MRPCCFILLGLIDLDIAICLCTAFKLSILGITINTPIHLNLALNVCGGIFLDGFHPPDPPPPPSPNPIVVTLAYIQSSPGSPHQDVDLSPPSSSRNLTALKLQISSIPAGIPSTAAPSYAERFKASLRNLRKIFSPSFLEDGTLVVQAPESVLLSTADLWKDHLVAHFHGAIPPSKKIFDDLNPVWGKFGKITIRVTSETSCLIVIPSIQTREWVLQVGYWQAAHCAFSVSPWSPDGNLAPQDLESAPTWMFLRNVPTQLYSFDSISVIASGISEPLHTEKSRLDPYHFGNTKIKVEIDLHGVLLAEVEVRDSAGFSVRVKVEYPSLPPKCCNCGRFGHYLNRCLMPPQKNRQAGKGTLPTPEVTVSGTTKPTTSRRKSRSRSRGKRKDLTAHDPRTGDVIASTPDKVASSIDPTPVVEPSLDPEIVIAANPASQTDPEHNAKVLEEEPWQIMQSK
ncbi:Uncharacterized protein Rs2_10245 [Raphanus sativus]|nr:Uncharacterized protein Rs2_10245 [Raphanus sativus]